MTVIAEGARTPIAKLSGAFASLSATDLGGFAITEALRRSNVDPADVDYVYMGHVLQAGAGQITARRAATNAGIPLTTPATTINKVCLSGLNTIYLAHQMVAAGEADIVVAGGMESMTNAPYLVPGARAGLRAGDATMVDSLFHDGLYCTIEHCMMGEATERYAATATISRDAQDALSAESHRRAAAATDAGILAEEIVPVSVPQRRGEPVVVSTDEGIRGATTADGLAKLRPAFGEGGNITAGNASQISDGASAVIVMSEAAAATRGLTPLATIISYGQIAGPDPSLLNQPSQAITAALGRSELSVSDIDLFEINEAFAAVALASMDDLGISDTNVNVHGGAVALGHPIGASGNRLALTLAYELRRRGGGVGAAALCGGGGQGDALLLRVG